MEDKIVDEIKKLVENNNYITKNIPVSRSHPVLNKKVEYEISIYENKNKSIYFYYKHKKIHICISTKCEDTTQIIQDLINTIDLICKSDIIKKELQNKFISIGITLSEANKYEYLVNTIINTLSKYDINITEDDLII